MLEASRGKLTLATCASIIGSLEVTQDLVVGFESHKGVSLEELINVRIREISKVVLIVTGNWEFNSDLLSVSKARFCAQVKA